MMRLLSSLLIALALAGCGSMQPRPGEGATTATYAIQGAVPVSPSKGGYYKDDGPGERAPDVDKIADPEPRVEPLNRFANNRYTVQGVAYVPMRSLGAFKQQGVASWYGKKFHGQRTSSGEIYDMYGMTAAHTTLPIPSYAKVTNLRNGRWVVVRVNDRGPFHSERVIDLSYAAAHKLGYIEAGSTRVEVELIQAEDMPRYARRPVTAAIASAADKPPPAAAPISIVSSAQAAESAADANPVYVQLGAFSAPENAEGLRARIARELAWLKEFVEVQQRDGSYRVRIGPYKSRADAAAAAEKVRDALQITPVLVGR
jgi:rare lipoprotein A